MECEKYGPNFVNNNNKNNLYYTIKSASLGNKSFLSSYIYININKAK